MKTEVKKFARSFDTANSEIINVNIIIATDKLLKDIAERKITPSMDPKHPTLLGHQFAYMVASGSAMKTEGSGTGDLSFEAAIGDIVRFTAVSEYNQFRSSVIMYDMFYISGDNVFQDKSFKLKLADNVKTPFPTSFEPFDVKNIPIDFYWAENSIQSAGTEFYGLQFAVYQIERGKAEPELKGFFGWDPKIIVKG